MIVRLLDSSKTPYKFDASKGEFTCRCLFPDHHDNHPSFGINIKKGIYKCWSRCGGGKVEFLLSKLDVTQEDIDLFVDDGKVELIKSICGIHMSGEEEDEVIQECRFPATAIHIRDTDEFMKYIISRGIDPNNVDGFDMMGCKIGRYQNRLLIPIRDSERMIGFMARDITSKQQPKNLFPPGVKIGQMIFKTGMGYSAKPLVVTEGMIDSIYLSQYISLNTCSNFSCHMTDFQFNQIAGITDCLICAYDADDAGRKGRDKIFEMCKKRKIDFGSVDFGLVGKNDANECTPDELNIVFKSIKVKRFTGMGLNMLKRYSIL